MQDTSLEGLRGIRDIAGRTACDCEWQSDEGCLQNAR